MSSQTTPQPQANPPVRGRGRVRSNRGRGRGGTKGSGKSQTQTVSPPNTDTIASTTIKEQSKGSVEAKESRTATEDGDVCWICAEPVKYYSVSDCDHRTCHVCALRLRALYKKLECTFCKVRETSAFDESSWLTLKIGTSTNCYFYCLPRR